MHQLTTAQKIVKKIPIVGRSVDTEIKDDPGLLVAKKKRTRRASTVNMEQYTAKIDMKQRKKDAKLTGRAARMERQRIKRAGGQKKADEQYFNRLVSGKRGDKKAQELADLEESD